MLSLFKRKTTRLIDLFPENFVDIHSHLLPGIDDGSKNMDESLRLISEMKSIGIQYIITSPHILGATYPNTPEIINSKLKDVNLKLGTNNHIKSGAEYMLDQQFEDFLEEDNLLALKDRFILIEMSYFNAPINIYEILFKIQLKGYTPILAHPERYHFLHNRFEEFIKLKNSGCKFQLNLLSLSPHYGKDVQQTANKLLKENFYDFVGTDVHNIGHIEKLKFVKLKKTTAEAVEKLCMNNLFFND